MKILIVDDERHVRETIKLLIDADQYGIAEWLEAPDGERAIALIEQFKPEIILTDMHMPIKNGVELLRWISQHYLQGKTIVISGHDDFEYVKHAVKYGGSDYILKPIDEDELNQALQKAISCWHKEQKERVLQISLTQEINQIKPVFWDKLFSNLVQEEISYASIAEQFELDFKMSGKPAQAQIAIISTELLPLFIQKKFSANYDLLFFLLANIVNEYLQKEHSGYAFRYWNSQHELLIVAWQSKERFISTIKQINDGIRLTLGSKMEIGIGTVKAFPQGLKESYQEAHLILKQRNLLRSAGNIHWYGDQEIPPLVPLPFSRFEADFKTSLQSAQQQVIGHAVAKWIDALRLLPGITIEQLELWHHEYTLFKARCLNELLGSETQDINSDGGAAYALQVTVDEQGKLPFEQLQANVEHDLWKLSQQLAGAKQRERNVIYEIVDYIEKNYQAEITLQHISERFFLSREYISRRFKQELNENLSDFIERIRIEKTKLLLGNPQLKIVQIAEMVGYRDEKYLSKVFKKAVGVSPNQYRKQLIKS